jgi:hypothetical protein
VRAREIQSGSDFGAARLPWKLCRTACQDAARAGKGKGVAEIKPIATVDELPKSGRYVLVMPGDALKTTRHSRGVTISVHRYTGDPTDGLKNLICAPLSRNQAKP